MGVVVDFANANFPDAYPDGTPFGPSTASMRGLAATIENAYPSLGNLVGETERAQAEEQQLRAGLTTLANVDAGLQAQVSQVLTVLGGKANGADLAAEALARAGADAILAAHAGVPMRPGDAPEAFTVSLAGGPPDLSTGLPTALVALGDNGLVARFTGAGLVAARSYTAIEPGRVYALRWVVRRRADSTDPSDDAIQLGIAWYDQAHGPLAVASTIPWTLTNPMVSDGRQERTALVSTVPGAGVTVPPPGALYYRIYARPYGTTPVTDVEVLASVDASNAVVNAPDVSALSARIAAQESIQAASRLATIESEIGAPASLTFATLATLMAASVPSTINLLQVLGNSVAGIGRQSYRRTRAVGPGPGLVQTMDGSWFLRSDPVAYATAFGADPSGAADAGAALGAAQAYLPAGQPLVMTAGTYALGADIDMTGRMIDASGAALTGEGGINGALFVRSLPTAVLAIGGNRGDVTAGLQIGGGNPQDGAAGNVLRDEGHASWTGFFPSRDLASMELACHTTAATGQVRSTQGQNTLVWTGKGTQPSAAWVGRKIWFMARLGSGVYRITGVSGGTISVANLDGSAVSFASAQTEVYYVAYVYGTGQCAVTGTTVKRIVGDPFVLYYADPSFQFRLDGIGRTVTGFTDTKTITLSSAPGDTTASTYEFFFDINNGQLTTLRLHRSAADVENLSLYTTPEGNFIQSQYGDYGLYRPIYIGSGELAYSPGSFARQIAIYPTGLSLGGDIGWDAIRILAPTAQPSNFFVTAAAPSGFGPSWRARGSDLNIGISYDTQGSGAHSFSSNAFGSLEFEIYGNGGTSYLAVGSDANGQPALSANGAPANIDIRFAPKGTGAVWLGAFAGQSDAPVTGYVLVKDSTGATRKLATVA